MIEFSLKVNRLKESDITTMLILDGVETFEVVDDNLSNSMKKSEKNWDYIDEKEPNPFIIFKFYVDDDDATDLANKFKGYDVTTRVVKEEDYANDWKSYFDTIEVSNDLRVVPLWKEHDDKDIIINPGMAFGTGSHETTYMCLKEIDNHNLTGNIMDVGTGSGILAITLAKLYNAKVDAYEIDTLAIKSCKENVSINEVKDKVNIFCGDFRDFEVKMYDGIVSNIYAETLCDMMSDFKMRIKKDGIIILSGIVKEKKDMVLDSLNENGFSVLSTSDMGGWSQITGKYNG